MSMTDVKSHLNRFCFSTNALEIFGQYHQFHGSFFKSANSIFLFDDVYEQQFVHLVNDNGRDDYVKPIFENYRSAHERADNGYEYKDYLLLHRPLMLDASSKIKNNSKLWTSLKLFFCHIIDLEDYLPRMLVTQYEANS